MKHKPTENKAAFIFIVLLALLAIGGIIYLKSLSDSTEDSKAFSAETNGELPIAVPDTGLLVSDVLETTETLIVAMPDTIGKDKRPAYEAGYEDGYFSGMDDGSQNAERASYDDSNSFPSPTEQAAYTKGYSEGYAKGFSDGRDGKQFNI